MAVLQIKLLGQFELCQADDELIDLPSRKARALLAYLVLADGVPQPREKLANLLWERSAEEQARLSLRQTLSLLRRQLKHGTTEPLIADRLSVALDTTAVSSDVAQFRLLAEQDEPEHWEQAATLYRGDLLEGLLLPGEAFNDWLRFEQQRLHEQFLSLLERLLAHYRAHGRHEEAIRTATRLLAQDPLREPVHRELIDSLLVLGRRRDAREQYQRCVELLRVELGRPPSADLDALHRRLYDPKPAAAVRSVLPPATPASVPLATLSDGHGRPFRRRTVLAILLVFAALSGWLIEGNWFFSAPETTRPTLAVLPFDTVGNDPEQAYFAEGFAEDLTSDLARLSGLSVIARHRVDAGAPFGTDARHVLEGSVQFLDRGARIHVRLIDTASGVHLWADDFDLGDFSGRKDVVTGIVAALGVELSAAERARLTRVPTDNLEAYDYYLRAEYRANAGYPVLAEALQGYGKAVRLDPGFADAWAGYARAAVDIWRFGYDDMLAPPVARRLAYEAASRALALDPDNDRPHAVLALLQSGDGAHDEALQSAQRAVALGPSSADAHLALALVQLYAGLREAAAISAETALRLNPDPPPGMRIVAGSILARASQPERALAVLEPVLETVLRDDDLTLEYLAMAYVRLGRHAEARGMIDDLLARFPPICLAHYRTLHGHYRRVEDLHDDLAALRAAGLPEWPFGYRGNLEQRLDANALRDLVYGRTWVGELSGGTPFVQQIDTDGTVAFRSVTNLLIGEASVEQGQLCLRFEAALLGRKQCGFVYRDPDSPEHYVHVNVFNLARFALAE